MYATDFEFRLFPAFCNSAANENILYTDDGKFLLPFLCQNVGYISGEFDRWLTEDRRQEDILYSSFRTSDRRRIKTADTNLLFNIGGFIRDLYTDILNRLAKNMRHKRKLLEGLWYL